METTITPRMYVACLAAYNNGRLHGRWIDAVQETDAIQAEIAAMLATSPVAGAEEWAIHDYEGFGELSLSEYEGIDRVHALARFIAEHGELGQGLLSHFSGDLEEAEAALENYAGLYDNLAEYAAELTEQTTEIPANLANYIDYDAMAHDMELSGDVFIIKNGYNETHVFLAA